MAYTDIEKRRAYLRQYARDLRAWQKAHHLCQQCGKKDAYTIAGRFHCYECAERRRIKRGGPEYIDPVKIPKPDNKPDRIPKDQYDERGLCKVCGKPRVPGFKVCEAHYQQMLRMRQIQKERGQDKTVRESITRQYKLSQGGL